MTTRPGTVFGLKLLLNVDQFNYFVVDSPAAGFTVRTTIHVQLKRNIARQSCNDWLMMGLRDIANWIGLEQQLVKIYISSHYTTNSTCNLAFILDDHSHLFRI